MICYPNAKINLGLYVTEKRMDGFHNIESIFLPIELCDILEVTQDLSALDGDTDVSFKNTGIQVDCDLEQNLIVKAYRLLKQDFELPAINIHLHKMIPFGAGLGGGSADAAFMLKALNEEFNLKLSIEQLEAYAAKLGSDCVFFIQNKPALVRGRGEELSPIEICPDLKGKWIAVVNPDIHVGTAEAYGGITPCKLNGSLLDASMQPIEKWRKSISNDFEKTVFAKHPEISQLKTLMYNDGAIYSSMTGSGSSVFGVFEDKPAKLCRELKGNNEYFAWCGEVESNEV